MAEIFLGSVADSITGHLVSLMSSEIGQAWGVKHELKRLKSTVSAITAVLHDAEKCRVENESIKDWLNKLRDVVYDADDLLDDFSTKALRLRMMAGTRILREVRIFFTSSNQLVYSFKMAHRVKGIRERLDDIKGERSNFEFEGIGGLEIIGKGIRGESYPFMHKSHVIGRKGDEENIIDFLLDPNFEDNVSILSMVGVGGLGKTTLAKLVFNDDGVQAYFKLKMWVCVSMNFDVENIVRKIIRECTDAV
ncbi:hypothetical protein CRG98_013037 [Punica granatum]|uniref:Disease resistance protein RGA3 n=1 Tax=Punica granatum TaxID=22663 RepID=A0A2I0KED5_PUNGR|nr:hypothetical protein CRG98_013037 [Punica granatum]